MGGIELEEESEELAVEDRYLEAADECRRDGAVEFRQHFVPGGDNGVQTLGGSSSDLPAHVVVVTVLVVTA